MAGPPPTGNNSADLSGAVLGEIAFDPASMRKLVPVATNPTLPGFQVGPMATITRSDPTTETAYLVLPVKNSGTDTRCFLEAQAFHWLNSAAQPLNDPGTFDFIGGSVGLTVAGTYTDTCLAPGETGYFLDIEIPAGTDALYSAVTSVELALTSSTSGTETAARLIPDHFDVGHCSGSRSVGVTAKNSGATPVTVAADGVGLGPAVLIDDGGAPAGWMYVERGTLTAVAPGQTTTLVASVPTTFSVQRAVFFLSFDGPDTATEAFAAAPMPLMITSAAGVAERVRAARARRYARWLAVTARPAPPAR
jgi:hypothetical protein